MKTDPLIVGKFVDSKTGDSEIDKLLLRLAELKHTGHIADICEDRIIAICDMLMLRNKNNDDLRREIAKLKDEASDNSDALLAAYQQGRAQGRKDAETQK